jgi:hypothetical protein
MNLLPRFRPLGAGLFTAYYRDAHDTVLPTQLQFKFQIQVFAGYEILNAQLATDLAQLKANTETRAVDENSSNDNRGRGTAAVEFLGSRPRCTHAPLRQRISCWSRFRRWCTSKIHPTFTPPPCCFTEPISPLRMTPFPPEFFDRFLGEAQGSTHAAQVHTLGSAQLDDAIRERLMVHHPSNALVHDVFWRLLVESLRDELEVMLAKIDPSGRWFRKQVLGEDPGHSAWRRRRQHLGFGGKKWPVKIEYLFDEP